MMPKAWKSSSKPSHSTKNPAFHSRDESSENGGDNAIVAMGYSQSRALKNFAGWFSPSVS